MGKQETLMMIIRGSQFHPYQGATHSLRHVKATSKQA